MNTIKILHNGQPLEIKQENGRYYVQFTAVSPTDKLTIQNQADDNKICDVKFIQTMLEKGLYMSDYEDNTSTETVLARLLEDVKELAIKTAGENTANEIKINSEGMVRRYTNADGSINYIAESEKGNVSITEDADYFAETVIGSNIFKRSITDKETGMFSEIYQTADGFGQSISNNKDRLNSLISDLTGTTQTLITKDAIAQTILTSEIFTRRIKDYTLDNPNLLKNSSFSPMRSTSEYLLISLNLAGVVAENFEYTIRVAGYFPSDRTEIRIYNSGGSVPLCTIDKTKDFIGIGTSADGSGVNIYEKTFKWVSKTETHTATNKFINIYAFPWTATSTSTLAWASLVRGKVGRNWAPAIQEIDAVETQVTQLKDSWAVKTLNGYGDILSQLNVNSGGVKIQGKLIHLDGNVTMNNAFARKLMVENLTATDITAFMGKFGNIIASNLDANKITTNMITAIEGAFLSANGSVNISRNQIEINMGSATKMTLNTSGLHYTDSAGNLIGWLGRAGTSSNGVYGAVLNLSVARGKRLTLGYDAGKNGTYKNALMFDGTTGEITFQGYQMSNAFLMLHNIYSIAKSKGGLWIPAKDGNSWSVDVK